MPAPQMGMSRTSGPSQAKPVTMEIQLKNPQTGTLSSYSAEAGENEREHDWAIRLPKGNTVFITERLGLWKARHGETISTQLIVELGLAITNHLSLKRLHWEKPDDPAKPRDDREAERISREQRII